MVFFSSISQPHNPDVVIASDDEDEFADLQRGTVILKSVSIDHSYRKTKTMNRFTERSSHTQVSKY